MQSSHCKSSPGAKSLVFFIEQPEVLGTASLKKVTEIVENMSKCAQTFITPLHTIAAYISTAQYNAIAQVAACQCLAWGSITCVRTRHQMFYNAS